MLNITKDLADSVCFGSLEESFYIKCLRTNISIDPEKTVTVKAPSLASLPYSEGSVYSTVVNPPRARPSQLQLRPLDARFVYCYLM